MEIVEKIASKLAMALVIVCAADLVGLKIPGAEGWPIYYVTGFVIAIWLIAALMSGKGLAEAMMRAETRALERQVAKREQAGEPEDVTSAERR